MAFISGSYNTTRAQSNAATPNDIGTLDGDNKTISTDLQRLAILLAQCEQGGGDPDTNAEIAKLINEIQSAANDIDRISHGTGPEALAAQAEIAHNTTFQALFGQDPDGKGLQGGEFAALGINTGTVTASYVEALVDYLIQYPDTYARFQKEISNFNPNSPTAA